MLPRGGWRARSQEHPGRADTLVTGGYRHRRRPEGNWLHDAILEEDAAEEALLSALELGEESWDVREPGWVEQPVS